MKTKKLMAILLIVVMAAGLLAGCDSNAKPYEDAEALFGGGKYAEAAAAFEALGDYKDAPERAEEARNQQTYTEAAGFFDSGSYEQAAEAFTALGGFKDAAERAGQAEEARKSLLYAEAGALLNSGQYEEAIAAFEALGSYKDAPAQAEEGRKALLYIGAEALLNDGKHEEAAAAFASLGDYRDAPAQAEEARKMPLYAEAEALFHDGNYKEAAAAFGALGDYKDAPERAAEADGLVRYIFTISSVGKFTWDDEDGNTSDCPADEDLWFANAVCKDASREVEYGIKTVNGYNVIDFDKIASVKYFFTFTVDGQNYKFQVRVGTKFVTRKADGGGYDLLPEESIAVNK